VWVATGAWFLGLLLTPVALLLCLREGPGELGTLLGDTAFGSAWRVQVIGLALFVVLLGGGAYNRMIVHPRLERAALGLDPDDRGATAALRVSVRAELAVAAALMVSVAVLVSLAPPG
jgi:putative copper export protein